MESILEVWVARDFTGVHVYNTEPIIKDAGGVGNIWSGYRNKALETMELIEKYKSISSKQTIKIQLKIIL